MAHELAHTILKHELSRVEKLGDVTFLSCDPTQEEEAVWLSGASSFHVHCSWRRCVGDQAQETSPRSTV